MVLFWVALGVVLLLVEMHHLAFFAMFGAAGSFAAAVVALFAPSGVGLQAAVAVGVGLAGVVAVRPFVSRALHVRPSGYAARGVHGGLVGSEAVTLDEVGDTHRSGHVRLGGERWLAVAGDTGPIPAHTVVVVTAVEGTTLVVWPVDHFGRDVPEIGSPDLDAPDGADGRTT
jgi:membrane protein implicated in regulation of membrane protease activity